MRERVVGSATLLTVGGLALLLCAPLLVALVVLHEPRWQPVSDIAQLEMRVRDVIYGPRPQIGLAGRFLAYGEVGSHPGALVFYLLAPVYWLFGSDGWALLVSTAVLTGVGTVLAIWMGHRRGGWQMALLVTGMLALLFRAHGPDTMLEPWTPHLVIVWWVVFLLAMWSVLCRDWPMLPLAVLAGSLCVQTHVGYSGIVLGLAGVALGWGVVRLIRDRRVVARDSPTTSRVTRAEVSSVGGLRSNGWVIGSTVLGLVLWLPTLLEELTKDPGNVTILVESFRHPFDERVSFSLALESWLAQLNPVGLVDGSLRHMGSSLPGLLFLAVWAGAVFLSWRRSDRQMLLLHGVVGVATVLGLVATTRIYGTLWSYLVQWAWGTTGLMLVAIVWTGWRELPARSRLAALSALGVGALVVVVMFTADATTAEMTQARLTAKTDRMVDATLQRLEDDPAHCGDDCHYRVTWSDPLYVASEAYGLMVDLERRDISAGPDAGSAPAVRSHRVIQADAADATLHVAVTDPVIAEASRAPGAERLAYVDPYTDEEHAANDELRAALVAALDAEGFDQLVEPAREGCTGSLLPIESRMSSELVGLVERVNSLYCPSAIFLILPESPPAGSEG